MSDRQIMTRAAPNTWRWLQDSPEGSGGKPWGSTMPAIRCGDLELILAPDGSIHQNVEDAFFIWRLNKQECMCLSHEQSVAMPMVRDFLIAIRVGSKVISRQTILERLFCGHTTYMALFSSWLEREGMIDHDEDGELWVTGEGESALRMLFQSDRLAPSVFEIDELTSIEFTPLLGKSATLRIL